MSVSTCSGISSGPAKILACFTPASWPAQKSQESFFFFPLFFPHLPISDLQGQTPKPLQGLGKWEARARGRSAAA